MLGFDSRAASRGWPCHSPLDSTRRPAGVAFHPLRPSGRFHWVVLSLLLSSPCWAQDGGVWVYRRAVLELEPGTLVTVDAGVALDERVAIARANELEQLRAADKVPSWLTVALSAVATGIWVADRFRAWTTQPP